MDNNCDDTKSCNNESSNEINNNEYSIYNKEDQIILKKNKAMIDKYNEISNGEASVLVKLECEEPHWGTWSGPPLCENA